MRILNKYKKCFLLLFCLVSVDLVAISNNSNQKLLLFVRHFSTFAQNYPQEKVYLHFDNTAYFDGETIWFKAYVVTAEQNGLTPLSKTLYVELLSPEGNVVESKKLKIENGQCHGHFELKNLRYGGFFEVRAYTRCMLNFDGSLFSRVFPVYDKPRTAGNYSDRGIYERPTYLRVPGPRKEYSQKGALQVSFFPEGGSLVQGISSKVALKATNRNGEDAFVMGDVLDEEGNKVSEIEPGQKGMGIFNIKPTRGKYTARVQYKNSEYSFELPPALPAGYTLSVDNSGNDEMAILIQRSRDLPTDTLGLTVSCRGKIVAFDEVIPVNGNAFEFAVPKEGLPTGVLQISLFNTSGDVLAERLVFTNQQNELNMSVAAEKTSLRPFERNRLDFKINDRAGNPVEATFSVAIRDAGTSQINPYADNVLTHLLLSSELKGYIEDPAFYFEKDDRIHRQALDLLMLSQGWSRYSWKKMAGIDSIRIKHPIEKSLLIEGRVLSPFKKREKENVEVKMTLMADSLAQRGECMTDKKGTFNLALTDFYGKGDLILQTKEGGKGKENYILLDRCFSPEVKSYSFYEDIIPKETIVKTVAPLIKQDSISPATQVESKNKDVKMDKKSHMLREVTVKGKKKFSFESITLKHADVVYDVEKEMDILLDKEAEEPTNIIDFMLRTNPYFNVVDYGDSVVCMYKLKSIGFSLNEFPFSTMEARSMPTDQIEKIVLCAGSLKWGINLYTYKDKHRGAAPKSFRKTKFEGYSYVKESFNPKYENNILPEEHDFRRTLYWNPDVKTNLAGKASVSFFNNGSCKNISVSAETVTANGKVGVINK